MHIAVFSFLHKIRMSLKIIFLRMFQYKISTWMKNISLEHLIRNGRKPVLGIRRICKYYIKLFTAYFQELKYVMAHYRKIAHTELLSL